MDDFLLIYESMYGKEREREIENIGQRRSKG
jgi:hypothetical protein